MHLKALRNSSALPHDRDRNAKPVRAQSVAHAQSSRSSRISDVAMQETGRSAETFFACEKPGAVRAPNVRTVLLRSLRTSIRVRVDAMQFRCSGRENCNSVSCSTLRRFHSRRRERVARAAGCAAQRARR
jgi:hypothetical protein